MTSIDDKIKQALNEEFNEIIKENEELDSNPYKQLKNSFKGKRKKLLRVRYLIMTFAYTFIIVGAYKILHTDDLKKLIMYTTAFLVFTIIVLVNRLWFQAELSRNRVIGEIKIVELQLAQLLKNQEKK